MSEIGAYEAKTHLPELLQRVQAGERFIITRHGHPVAQLIPITDRKSEEKRLALDRLRACRERLRARGIRLSDLLGEDESLRDLAHDQHRY
jgi:prevent-host-death family protein